MYVNAQNGPPSRGTIIALTDSEEGAVNKLGFCVLSFSLSTVAGGAISTTLAALYIPPAGGVVRDAFAPRKPGTTPMPAPASTEHYAASPNGIVA